MAENSGQVPAGWYPDPSGAPRQRYFDGEVWTDDYHGETAAMAGGAAGMAAASKGPLDHWKTVMTEKYADFNGRARRAEYWWAYLINIVIMIVLFIIGAIIGSAGLALPILFGLGVIIPSISSGVRRLHDTGKSGWWLLISFVPFIGGIWQIVLLATEGDRNANQYGGPTK